MTQPRACPQCGTTHTTRAEPFCSDECEAEYWPEDERRPKSSVPTDDIFKRRFQC